MKITILNPDFSKTKEMTETKMLWTSLLLARQVYYAGGHTWILDMNNYFSSLEDRQKYLLMERIAPVIFKEKEILEMLPKFLEGYRKYYLIKHKNRDELLVFLKAKRGLDQILKMTLYKFNCVSKDFHLQELFPLVSSKSENGIYPLPFLYASNSTDLIKERIDLITRLFVMHDHMFLLNSSILENIHAVNFQKVTENFNEINSLHFLFGDLARLPSLELLNNEHFSVLRNNFLNDADVFSTVFKEVEETLLIAEYINETALLMGKLFKVFKDVAIFFNNVIENNQLLSELTNNGSINGYNKIYFAVTSKEYLLDIMEKSSIIDNRDKMYISQKINNYLDIKTICPFLIFEEGKNEC